MHTMYAGSTNVVTLADFFDRVDKQYQNGATVVVTLKNSAGQNISGAVNVPMGQVAGTSGRTVLYRCEIAHTVSLPAGTDGTAVVVATNTAGKVRQWTEAVRYEN